MFADFNFIKGTFVEINLFAAGVMKRMSNTLANQKCNPQWALLFQSSGWNP